MGNCGCACAGRNKKPQGKMLEAEAISTVDSAVPAPTFKTLPAPDKTNDDPSRSEHSSAGKAPPEAEAKSERKTPPEEETQKEEEKKTAELADSSTKSLPPTSATIPSKPAEEEATQREAKTPEEKKETPPPPTRPEEKESKKEEAEKKAEAPAKKEEEKEPKKEEAEKKTEAPAKKEEEKEPKKEEAETKTEAPAKKEEEELKSKAETLSKKPEEEKEPAKAEAPAAPPKMEPALTVRHLEHYWVEHRVTDPWPPMTVGWRSLNPGAPTPEVAVALVYQHGTPVMGRAWKDPFTRTTQASFGYAGRELTSISHPFFQLLCTRQVPFRGYEYSWLSYSELKGNALGWEKVHESKMGPCVCLDSQGREWLGKMDWQRESASFAAHGREYRFEGSTILAPFRLLARRRLP